MKAAQDKTKRHLKYKSKCSITSRKPLSSLLENSKSKLLGCDHEILKSENLLRKLYMMQDWHHIC